MATTSKLRPILHVPSWELMGTNSYAHSFSNGDNSFGFISPYFKNDFFFHWPSAGTAAIYRFDAEQNSFAQIVDLTGSFSSSAGAATTDCAYEYAAPAGSILLSATAGTTTSITTTLTIKESIVGRTVRIIEGPNAGQEFVIKSYTTGANSVFTFTTTAGAAFTSATKFHLITGSIWHTSGANLYCIDLATKTIVSRTSPAFPTGAIADLIALHRADDNYFSGTITLAAATTATLPAAASSYNFTNQEIFITGGTGAGQIRRITAQASNVITVASAWTTTPDSTSTFKIRGDSDALMVVGGSTSSASIYKYSISSNTWTTLTPSPSRGLTMGTTSGGSELIRSGWDTPSFGAGIAGGQNGRFIFSMRPAGSTPATTGFDVYDIASNGWTKFDNMFDGDPLATNSNTTSDGRYIYHMVAMTGRYWRFDPVSLENKLLAHCPYPHGTAASALGGKMWVVKYNDGGDTFTFLYSRLFGGKYEFLRLMIIE